jgi:uncharacterized protein (DUF433 family)
MGFFLKLIGSTDAPWQGLYEEDYVDFPQPPRQVGPGDYLVLYAVGGLKRVFAVAEVKSKVYEAPARNTARWPYRVKISYLVNMPASEGVPLEEVRTLKRDLTRSINQHSYMKLSPEEYQQALTKLRTASGTGFGRKDAPLLPKDKGGEDLKEYGVRDPISLPASTEPVPLESHAGGVIRIRGTRVSLDSVIFAFNEGSTPEEIVQQYTTLDLADVYVVISFYLRHREEVQEYLSTRRQQRDEIRREVEARFDPHGIRDRLLARRRRIA